MKNKKNLLAVLVIALVLGMTACDNGGGNDETISSATSITYESKAVEDVYVLVITQNQNTGRAAYSANTGLAFVLKFYPSSGGTKKATSGKVKTVTRDTIELEAPSATVDVTITITVTLNSEDKMIALIWEGKITWDDNQQTVAPTTLEPVIEDEGLVISDGVLLS